MSTHGKKELRVNQESDYTTVIQTPQRSLPPCKSTPFPPLGEHSTNVSAFRVRTESSLSHESRLNKPSYRVRDSLHSEILIVMPSAKTLVAVIKHEPIQTVFSASERVSNNRHQQRKLSPKHYIQMRLQTLRSGSMQNAQKPVHNIK